MNERVAMDFAKLIAHGVFTPALPPKRGYGLKPYHAELLSRYKPLADFFEWLVYASGASPQACANCICNNMPFFLEVFGATDFGSGSYSEMAGEYIGEINVEKLKQIAEAKQ